MHPATRSKTLWHVCQVQLHHLNLQNVEKAIHQLLAGGVARLQHCGILWWVTDAVMSRISLWQIVGNPPLWQTIAWSTVNESHNYRLVGPTIPQVQCISLCVPQQKGQRAKMRTLSLLPNQHTATISQKDDRICPELVEFVRGCLSSWCFHHNSSYVAVNWMTCFLRNEQDHKWWCKAFRSLESRGSSVREAKATQPQPENLVYGQLVLKWSANK